MYYSICKNSLYIPTDTEVSLCRIEGIVVAKENEEILLEAWRQEEQLIIEKQIKVEYNIQPYCTMHWCMNT